MVTGGELVDGWMGGELKQECRREEQNCYSDELHYNATDRQGLYIVD